ncbi:lysoplasmalogenase TMEM86B [Rhynchocyon petersi]
MARPPVGPRPPALNDTPSLAAVATVSMLRWTLPGVRVGPNPGPPLPASIRPPHVISRLLRAAPKATGKWYWWLGVTRTWDQHGQQILQVARWLSPFFLTCTGYFLLWIPEDPPSLLGALVKCLPVLSLAAFLWGCGPRGRYTTLYQGALLCSAVGDACLIWPDAFLWGMIAFAAAHVLYLAALGFHPLRLAVLLPILLFSGLHYSVLLPSLPSDMTVPLAIYSLLLASMLWRGLVQGGSAGLGALLFTISDIMVAWDTFSQPLPHARLMIMTTYYAAQALISLSAISCPRFKMN